jgi:hypothetical protein
MSRLERDSHAGCFDSQHLWGRHPMKTILAAAAALGHRGCRLRINYKFAP